VTKPSTVPLSRIVSALESGGRPRGGIVDGEGEVFSLGGEHLNEHGGFDLSNERFIPRAFYEQMKRGVVKPRDILIVKDGATTGKVSYVGENLPHSPCAINEHLFRLALNDKAADPAYVFYYLLSPRGNREILQDFRGATVGGISQKFIEKVHVPLPPLPEQKRIAALLAKADRLRRLRRYARKLSDTYLQSVFLEMFGDPVSNPMGWETVDLGKVISIISGHGFKKAEYSDNGVRLLQIANVSFQEIVWDALAYLPTDYLEHYPKLVLKPGDLLMALNRPILGHRVKFAVLKEDDCPAILYQRVGKFVIKSDQLHRDYLYGFMLTDYFYRELEVRLAGSDQPYINPTELIKMRFVLPPLPRQQQFAHIVHKFERLCAQQREAERQTEHLFRTLLHRKFRGELRPDRSSGGCIQAQS
jgi:type I restriction enzyme S subunit